MPAAIGIDAIPETIDAAGIRKTRTGRNVNKPARYQQPVPEPALKRKNPADEGVEDEPTQRKTRTMSTGRHCAPRRAKRVEKYQHSQYLRPFEVLVEVTTGHLAKIDKAAAAARTAEAAAAEAAVEAQRWRDREAMLARLGFAGEDGVKIDACVTAAERLQRTTAKRAAQTPAVKAATLQRAASSGKHAALQAELEAMQALAWPSGVRRVKRHRRAVEDKRAAVAAAWREVISDVYGERAERCLLQDAKKEVTEAEKEVQALLGAVPRALRCRAVAARVLRREWAA
eukprot:jgi/Ulvmu1/1437/UM011_0167.1